MWNKNPYLFFNCIFFFAPSEHQRNFLNHSKVVQGNFCGLGERCRSRSPENGKEISCKRPRVLQEFIGPAPSYIRGLGLRNENPFGDVKLVQQSFTFMGLCVYCVCGVCVCVCVCARARVHMLTFLKHHFFILYIFIFILFYITLL